MNIKTAVGIGLALFAYVFGSILILAFMQNSARSGFPFIFLIFSIAFILVLAWIIRDIFTNKFDILIMVFFGLIISLLLSYNIFALLAGSTITIEELSAQEQEIENITSLNQNNINYISYLQNTVKEVWAYELKLQAEIEKTQVEIVLQNATIESSSATISDSEIIQKPVPIDDDYYENEYEEEDDD
jgi:hypothetical protein